MKPFSDMLSHFSEATTSEIELLKQNIYVKKFKKGAILQHKGGLNTYLYFVNQGLLRSYSLDLKGKEHIFMFASEGWMITEASDINFPKELVIDALEDTEVEMIDRKIFVELYLPLTLKHNKFNPESLFKRISVMQKRIIMLMSASAIERFEHFIETYPNIIQRVPQKMIASYLGITPEALSKVKGDRAKNK